MRCADCQAVLRSFLDGKVSGEQRREIGLHLAECETCAALIEEDGFWDDALLRHLDHEVPSDLRADILGDLSVPAADFESQGSLDHLGRRKQWQIIWWSIRRDFSEPRRMIGTAAVVAAALLAVNFLVPGRTDDTKPFTSAGPIIEIDQNSSMQTEDTVLTGRITLSGRLI